MELEVDASALFQTDEYANYEGYGVQVVARLAKNTHSIMPLDPLLFVISLWLPALLSSAGAMHIINALSVTGMSLHQSVRSQPTKVDTVQFDGIVRSSGSR